MLSISTVQKILQHDETRLMLTLVLQTGLSTSLKFIRSTGARYWYSLLLGTCMQLIVYGWHFLIVLGFGILMFHFMKVFKKNAGGAITFISMLFLLGYHLYGVLEKYGENKMDEVVLLMIMVCKYSLFAYAYVDGHYPQPKKQTQSQDTQDIQQKPTKINRYMITQQVSLAQYVGYLQFLPTSIMGPPIEYKIYNNFIKLQQQFANQLPSRKSIMLQTVREFVGCCVFFVLGLTVFPPSYMTTPEFYSQPSIVIFLYSVVSVTLIRFKYYSAWKIGIASVHSSGVSYNVAQNSYTAINHCNAITVQTSEYIRDKIGNWNIMVQEWLRKCIYERSPFKSKFLSQLHVFMVSAFWHGLYFGYYLSFFMWFMQVYMQVQVYRIIKAKEKAQPGSSQQGGAQQGTIQTDESKPKSKQKKKTKRFNIYTILHAILASMIFSHNATFFYLLRFDLCWLLMQRVYFIPQLFVMIGVIVSTFVGKKSKRTPRIIKTSSASSESSFDSASQPQIKVKVK